MKDVIDNIVVWSFTVLIIAWVAMRGDTLGRFARSVFAGFNQTLATLSPPK